MLLLNSLRRRSHPTDTTLEKPSVATSDPKRKRSSTAWSANTRRRRGIPWNLRMSKSDESHSAGLDATVDEVHPKNQPRNINHTPASSEMDTSHTEELVEPVPRGRSLSWSIVNPFSSLRRRSQSKSRSSSPGRNILQRAAELVKAPTAYFYKERASEESANPLTRDTSPVKSLRSKKSVRFLSDDEDSELRPQSSPIPIPGRSAPSLPPVEVSTTGLMNISDGTIVPLSGRPPSTPIIEALVAQSNDLSPTQAVLGSPVLNRFHRNHRNDEKYQDDPFDELAAIHTTQDSTATESPQGKMNDTAGLDYSQTCLPAEAGEESPQTATVAQKGQKLVKHIVVRNDTKSSSQVSLPLRLKHPKDVIASEEMQYNHKSKSDPSAPIETTQYLQGAIVSPGELKTNTKPAQWSAKDVSDCVLRLQRMSIRDDSTRETVPSAKTTQRDSVVVEDRLLASNSLPGRNGSKSPNRRRFRYENRADSSAGAQDGGFSDSSEAQRARQTPQRLIEETVDLQTPSPSNIPLPASTHPVSRDIKLGQACTFRDQHGWSPFSNDQFAEAVVNAVLKPNGDKQFVDMISKHTGFASFWKEASLSSDTAPRNDSEPPSRDESDRLLEAILRWADHSYSESPMQNSLRSNRQNIFPVKYFRKHDISSKEGFFAPVTSFKDNGSSEALSESTYTSGIGTNDQCYRSGSQSLDASPVKPSLCGPECTCSPCECSPCLCGTGKAQIEDDQDSVNASAPVPTADCTCNPCKCDPCRCGDIAGDKKSGQVATRHVHSTPTQDVSNHSLKFNSRNFSASSEPYSKTRRKLPLIGSVPTRYFNGGSKGSETTLASDTTLDEDEAKQVNMY